MTTLEKTLTLEKLRELTAHIEWKPAGDLKPVRLGEMNATHIRYAYLRVRDFTVGNEEVLERQGYFTKREWLDLLLLHLSGKQNNHKLDKNALLTRLMQLYQKHAPLIDGTTSEYGNLPDRLIPAYVVLCNATWRNSKNLERAVKDYSNVGIVTLKDVIGNAIDHPGCVHAQAPYSLREWYAIIQLELTKRGHSQASMPLARLEKEIKWITDRLEKEARLATAAKLFQSVEDEVEEEEEEEEEELTASNVIPLHRVKDPDVSKDYFLCRLELQEDSEVIHTYASFRSGEVSFTTKYDEIEVVSLEEAIFLRDFLAKYNGNQSYDFAYYPIRYVIVKNERAYVRLDPNTGITYTSTVERATSFSKEEAGVVVEHLTVLLKQPKEDYGLITVVDTDVEQHDSSAQAA
jgi:hypothetical protein